MLKIALRNILRNKRRTLLNLTLIALGTAALFLFRGYTKEIYIAIKESFIESLWHLQITHKDYWKGRFESYEYIIPEEKLAQIKEILAQNKEVISIATQLRFSGLVGTEKRSTSFMAIGIEPDNAPDWVARVDQGRKLTPEDKGKAVLSQGLADNLGVKLDDYVVVTTTTVDGAYNAGNLQIVGLYEEGERFGVVPISFAQKMLRTRGVERIYVKLAGDKATLSMAEHLRSALAANGMNDLEVKTWSDLADFYHRVRQFLGSIFGFISLVVFILVFFSVLEAMTMAFFERMREIGTIRAIGTKRHQVFMMFLSEGAMLGFIGGLLGAGLGWGLGAFINSLELTYIPPTVDEPIPFIIGLGMDTASVPFLMALLSTLVSTLYPAYRATRTEIVEALRYV